MFMLGESEMKSRVTKKQEPVEVCNVYDTVRGPYVYYDNEWVTGNMRALKIRRRVMKWWIDFRKRGCILYTYFRVPVYNS